MKRVIKAFLNGETGSRVREDSPKSNYSEKAQAHYLVAIMGGGYNEEKDELISESVEVLWADEADLLKAKIGTTVVIS